MKRRLVFASVVLSILGAGLVHTASAATHVVCVGDPNPHNPAWCVTWTDPKP